MSFKNRVDAGQRLAARLEELKDEPGVVYALPRGGVVLGAIIAHRLHAPLDLVITRKIGHPLAPEYAIGAVTEDGYLVGNWAELAAVDRRWLQEHIEAERQEARRRREVYLAGRRLQSVAGKTAVIVDDGVATGLTLRAAIRDVRGRQPRRIVVGVPVIPRDVADVIRDEVDELIALEVPVIFLGAVGAYYNDFPPVEDDEVIGLMHAAQASADRTPIEAWSSGEGKPAGV
jgi:predicted phosphoribosyltransferase